MTTLRRRRQIADRPSGEAWTDAHLVLLAHLIGDGCHLKRHVLQYTTTDPANVEAVRAAAWEAFGVAARVQRERSWYQVYLSTDRSRSGGRNPIAAWLDELGLFDKRSWEKFVPASVFGLGRASIALFLRHLWATTARSRFPAPASRGSTTAPAVGSWPSTSSRCCSAWASSPGWAGSGSAVAATSTRPTSRVATSRWHSSSSSAAMEHAARRSRACGPSSSLGGPTPTST